MNNRTISAIKSVAAMFSNDFEVKFDGDEVVVSTYYTLTHDDEYMLAGRYVDKRAEAHQLDSDRWILVSWNERHCQWQSSDFSKNFLKYNPQASYCFSRNIDSLAGDIRTYPSAAAAMRAAFIEQ